MRKLAILKCSVCSRETEHEVDNSRITPLNCVITHRCTGKLSLIGYKDVRSVMHPVPSTNYQDWIKRGTEISQPETKFIPRISVQGGDHHLVMIAKETPKTELTLRLKTTVSNENTKAYQYYFIRGTTTAAFSGADDSLAHSFLNCSPFDVIKVFVNSEELPKEAYKVEENRIAFAEPLIAERNIIKVFVYKPEAIRNYLLKFIKPSNTFNESAWGNVKKILLNNEVYDVFISTDIVNLSIGGQYILSDGVSENQMDLTDVYLLFANKPYSSYDRLMSSIIDLKDAASNRFVFEYGVDDFSQIRLTLGKDQITETFPPIKIIERNRYSSDFILESETVTKSNIETKKIIGPV